MTTALKTNEKERKMELRGSVEDRRFDVKRTQFTDALIGRIQAVDFESAEVSANLLNSRVR